MPRRPGRTPLTRRLTLWFGAVFLAAVAILAFLSLIGARRVLLDGLADGLTSTAVMVRGRLPEGGGLEAEVRRLAIEAGSRITVIDRGGTVIADSQEDPARMENHAGRPEVRSASTGEVGVSLRYSGTTNQRRLYVALPPDETGRIVRMSLSEGQIAGHLTALRDRIAGAAVVVGIGGLALFAIVSAFVGRSLRGLVAATDRMASGNTDVRPPRSSVREFDAVATAIAGLAEEVARRAMEEEEERQVLETVLSALAQGVLLVGGDDRIVYANPALEAMIGDVPDRLPTLIPVPLQRLVRGARRTGAPAQETIELGSPERMLRASATPFQNDARVLVVVVDVTESRRTERMRRDFVADASHELKTPVASALASVEALLIALGRNPDRAEAFAREAERSVRRLSGIVEDLLDLSRLESSAPAFEMLRLDLVVIEETDRVRERARESGVDLGVTVEPVSVRGSRRDLGLAIRNLCDNALRYTDPGGSVAVTVGPAGDRAVVEVADTGSGIPTRMLTRVFERFFRVDEARSRASGGTGLGLAIVKHVVEGHGGRVSVDSELGVGSTFRIDLPIAG